MKTPKTAPRTARKPDPRHRKARAIDPAPALPRATVDALRPDPANPNRMSSDDKARMAKSLAEFGDLSGVILNRRTGLLIGGHQRADVLAGAKLDVRDLTAPEPDGTVARGYLTHGGKRYAVRVVDWPDAKAHAALLAANRFGRVAADDPALLKDLLEELDTGDMDMDLTGYTAEAIEELMTQTAPSETVEDLTPIKRLHVLVSMTADQGLRLLPQIEALAESVGAQVHHASN